MDAMDRARAQTYFLVDHEEVNEHIENEYAERDRRTRNKFNEGRRYAKDDDEMQRDIFSFFKSAQC